LEPRSPAEQGVVLEKAYGPVELAESQPGVLRDLVPLDESELEKAPDGRERILDLVGQAGRGLEVSGTFLPQAEAEVDGLGREQGLTKKRLGGRLEPGREKYG